MCFKVISFFFEVGRARTIELAPPICKNAPDPPSIPAESAVRLRISLIYSDFSVERTGIEPVTSALQIRAGVVCDGHSNWVAADGTRRAG
jgi:hypothetical protein